MAISLVRFSRLGVKTQTLALYPGIAETEVRRLLRAALQLESSVPLKQFSDHRGQLVTLHQVVTKPSDFTQLSFVDSTKPQPSNIVPKSSNPEPPTLNRSDHRVRPVQSELEFYNVISEISDALIVVEFFTSWCEACKAIMPAFEAFSNRFPSVYCYRVNADKLPNLSVELGVSLVPVYQFFLGAQKLGELVGPTPQELLDMLHLTQRADFVQHLQGVFDEEPEQEDPDEDEEDGGDADDDEDEDDDEVEATTYTKQPLRPAVAQPAATLRSRPAPIQQQQLQRPSTAVPSSRVSASSSASAPSVSTSVATRARPASASALSSTVSTGSTSVSQSHQSPSSATSAASVSASSSSSSSASASERATLMREYRVPILLEVVDQMSRPPTGLAPVVDATQAALLRRLIAQHDELVESAFEGYLSTGDMRQFVDRLVALVHHRQKQPHAEFEFESEFDPIDEDEEDEENDDGQYATSVAAASASSSTSVSRASAATSTSVTGRQLSVRVPAADDDEEEVAVRAARAAAADAEDDLKYLDSVRYTIQALLRQDLIPQADAHVLLEHLAADEERGVASPASSCLFGAYLALEVDRSLDEYVDTLARVARQLLRQQVQQENSKAQVMLATYEQLSLLLRLHQSGLLSPATTATLYALREAEDQNLLAAFAAFRQDQDVAELVDTLQRIASKYSGSSGGGGSQNSGSQGVDADDADVEAAELVQGDSINVEADNSVDGDDEEESDGVVSSSAGEVIRSWSELVRQVAAHVTVERSFSSDEVLALLSALINQEELFVDLLEKLLGSGITWPQLMFAFKKYLAFQASRATSSSSSSSSTSVAANTISSVSAAPTPSPKLYPTTASSSAVPSRTGSSLSMYSHSSGSRNGSQGDLHSAGAGLYASALSKSASAARSSTTSLDREVAAVLTMPLSLREGIQRVLDMMLREGSLTSRQVAFLMDLVDDKDSVLLAAFQLLLEDGLDNDEAFDEFEDTVLRVVRLRMPASSSSSPVNDTKTYIANQSSSSSSSTSSVAAASSSVPNSSPLTSKVFLGGSEHSTRLDTRTPPRPVSPSPHLADDDDDEEEDEEELLGGRGFVASSVSVKSNQPQPQQQQVDEDDGVDEEDDDEAMSVALRSKTVSALQQDAQAAMARAADPRALRDETLFVRVLADEGLISRAESHALLRRLASGDPVLRAALDVYRADGQLDELVDTLGRCLTSSSRQDVEEEEEDGAHEEAMHDAEISASAEQERLREALLAVADEEEQELENGGAQDDGEIVVDWAQMKPIFTTLLAWMRQTGQLDVSNMVLLAQLFNGRDPAIQMALEAFVVERDVKALRDTVAALVHSADGSGGDHDDASDPEQQSQSL